MVTNADSQTNARKRPSKRPTKRLDWELRQKMWALVNTWDDDYFCFKSDPTFSRLAAAIEACREVIF